MKISAPKIFMAISGLILLLCMMSATTLHAAGTFKAGPDMGISLRSHSATLLNNGKILVTGGITTGNSVQNSARIFDPTTNSWRPVSGMATPRYLHTATLLPNGKVIVIGGLDAVSQSLSSAELYDPRTDIWTDVTRVDSPVLRKWHTATVLQDGRLLVIGGTDNGTSCELYDPANNTWSNAAPLGSARTGHTATRLPDGSVLVTGGLGLKSAALYTPDAGAGTWTGTTGDMSVNRRGHTATLLADGKVLIAAGFDEANYLATSELYDPATKQFTLTPGTMSKGRFAPTAALLPDGAVLLAGGENSPGDAELYLPNGSWSSLIATTDANRSYYAASMLADGRVLLTGGTWTSTTEFFSNLPAMTVSPSSAAFATGRYNHQLTLLKDGRALLAGGWTYQPSFATLSSAYLYDPASDSFTATGAMNSGRDDFASVLLQDGKVLLVGGRTSSGITSPTAELFDAGLGTFTELTQGTNNLTPRDQPAAALLPNGKVLVAGGFNSGQLASAELFDPTSLQFSPTGSMASPRTGHTATTMNDGRVLIAGGYDGANYVAYMEIYNPATGSFSNSNAYFYARVGNSATLLKDGRVLIAGGWNGSISSYLNDLEIYDPVTDSTMTVTLGIPRADHNAVLLEDGRVVLVGGRNSSTSYMDVITIFDPRDYSVEHINTLNSGRYKPASALLADGRILVTGGDQSGGPLTSSEIINPGISTLVPGRPAIQTTSPPPRYVGGRLLLDGTGFTGISEGSSGGSTSQSSAALPVVKLRNLSTGGRFSLLSSDTVQWNATTYNSELLGSVPAGLYLATLTASGRESLPVGINITHAVSATPNILSFGQLNIPSTATATITVTNSAAVAVAISASLAPPASSLTITGDSCGSSLAANSICQITLTYAPTTAESLNTRLKITTDQQDSQLISIPVSGSAILPSYNLGVSSNQNGCGFTVAPTTPDLSCYYGEGNGCSHQYVAGTTLTIKPLACPGYMLSSWSQGACNSIVNGNCTVTITGNTYLSGTFTPVSSYLLPFHESFDSGSLPVDWSLSTDTSGGDWQFSTIGNTTGGSGGYATIGTYTWNAELVTPAINMIGAVKPTLEFKTSYTGSTNNLFAELSTDNKLTWSSVWSWSAGPIPAQTVSADLTSLISSNPGNVFIRFRFANGDGLSADWSVDDVRVLDPATVSINVISNGGRIDSSPAGISDCRVLGGTCSATFSTGMLQLNATADSGYIFNGWSGDCSGSANPYYLKVDANKTCSAVFAEDATPPNIGIDTMQQYRSSWGWWCSAAVPTDCQGAFNAPTNISLDSSGNIYVSDTFNHRIEKFDHLGNYLMAFGSYGTGNGQLNKPLGTAVDSSGSIYVADTNNNRIQKFDPTGSFLLSWGGTGSGNGQFRNPVGVAVDQSGNVFVTDMGNFRVQKFNPNGGYLDQWGTAGNGNGQFGVTGSSSSGPRGIALDMAGNIYIADFGNNRIQKFNPSGSFLFKYDNSGNGDSQLNNPYGITIDKSGNLYVSDSNQRVQKFSSAFGYLGTFGTNGTWGSSAGQFNWVRGVAVDSSDTLYAVDSNNNRIQKFSPWAVTSSSPDGLYGTGDQVNITVNFTKAVSSTGLTLFLNSGGALYTGPFSNLKQWSGTHFILPGEITSSNLNVTAVEGTVTDGNNHSNSSLTIPPDGNLAVTKNIAIENRIPFTITTNGTGGGNVNIYPTGQSSFSYGTYVSLSASPNPGSVFTGWSGDCVTGGTNPYYGFTIYAPTSCTATFSLSGGAGPYTVNFTTTTGGTLGGTTSQSVSAGASTTAVTATPDANYSFAGWSGSGTVFSTANPLTVTNVQSNMTLTALFVNNSAPTPGTIDLSSTNPSVSYYMTAVAVNPVTNKIYMINRTSYTVSVIDGATKALIKSIDLYPGYPNGAQPIAIVVNPVTNRIFVADYMSNSVATIDGDSDTKINETSLYNYGNFSPTALAVDTESNTVYAAAYQFGSGRLFMIDGSSGYVQNSIPLSGAAPFSMAINPLTGKLLVGSNGGIDVISGGAITATFNNLSTPAIYNIRSLEVDTVNNAFFAVGNPGFARIDGAADTITPLTFTGLSSPEVLAFNRNTGTLYALDIYTGAVGVFNSAGTQTATVTTGVTSPKTILANPLMNKVFVGGTGSTTNFAVIDGASNTVAPFHVGTASDTFRSLASNFSTSTVYAASWNITPTALYFQGPMLPTNLPEVLIARNGDGSLNLNASTSLATPVKSVYYRYDTASGPWMKATPVSGNSFSAPAAANLTPGQHTIYAFATDGQDSTASSNGQGFFSGSDPNAPTGSSPLVSKIASYSFTEPVPPTDGSLLVTAADQSITLSWSGFVQGTNPIDHYLVTYSTTAPPATCSGGSSVASTESTFYQGGLTNGTQYFFRVCAVDSGGISSRGATASTMAGVSKSLTITNPNLAEVVFVPQQANTCLSSTCLSSFIYGTEVTLTAVAGLGDTFNWSGCDSSSGAACFIRMTADRAVTVTVTPFTAPQGKRIAAGFSHSVILKNDGTVRTFGQNNYQQLGDMTAIDSSLPLKTNSIADVVSVDAGENHTVALKTDGTVWTWGAGNRGQGGDYNWSGTISSPVKAKSLNAVTAIAAGWNHTLALRVDGTLWSWGQGTDSQLGTGSIYDSSYPQQVYGLPDVVAIAAGRYHSLALRRDGTVWAWGGNLNGQIGNGTNSSAFYPVKVTGISNAVKIAAAEESSFALLADGSIMAWGSNNAGVLGTGDVISHNLPVPVNVTAFAGKKVTALATKGSHLLVTTEDGKTWGIGWNYYGQLGNGTTGNAATPALVIGISNPMEITAGYGHSLALMPDGSVRGWGWDGFGQLGDGRTLYQLLPQQIAGVTASDIAAGYSFSLAIDQSTPSNLWSWGDNWLGQLGDGTVNLRQLPVNTGFTDFVHLAANENHTLAIDRTNLLYGWGLNWDGQLGIAASPPVVTPTPLGTGTYLAVSTGTNHTLALDSGGALYAWGNNGYGQLGDTVDPASRETRFNINAVGTISSISAGAYFSLALDNSGSIWSWGLNSSGQLGDGSWVSRTAPAAITTTPAATFTAISAGSGYALALDSAGQVWAWGLGGMSGIPGAGDTATPRVVPGLPGITQIFAGLNHALAIDINGNLWVWGGGQVKGDGTLWSPVTPVKVRDAAGTGYLSTVVKAVSGERHILAVLTDGSVYSWGYNQSGQLGSDPGVIKLLQSPTLASTVPESLSIAVDAPGLTFTTGGDAPWYSQPAPGSSIARSGTIRDNQISWLETSVSNANSSIMTFKWKVSSDPYDRLCFSLDNNTQPGCIGGEYNWKEAQYLIPAGTHTLRWTYMKNGWDSAGADTAWVDAISFCSGSYSVTGSATTTFTGGTGSAAVTDTGSGNSCRWISWPATTGVSSSSSGTAAGSAGFTTAPSTSPFPEMLIVAGVPVMIAKSGDGGVDLTFAAPKGITENQLIPNGWDEGIKTVAQPDGKIVVAMISHTAATQLYLTRYNSDGTLDIGFGSGGTTTTIPLNNSSWYKNLALQPSTGRILLSYDDMPSGVDSTSIYVVAYDSTGTIDATFATNGIYTFNPVAVSADFSAPVIGNSMAVDASGNILVGGSMAVTRYPDGPVTSRDMILLRLLANGSALDGSFGTGGLFTYDVAGFDDAVTGIAVLPGGRIIASGDVGQINNTGAVAVMLDSSGNLDTTFGSGGSAVWYPSVGSFSSRGMALQSDGSVVVAGIARHPDNSSDDGAVIRFTPTGVIDTGFATGGVFLFDSFPGDNDEFFGIALQSDGKLLLSGTSMWQRGDYLAFTMRLDTAGAPDPSFGLNGVVQLPGAYGEGITTQADGKIVTTGERWVNQDSAYVMRLNATGSTLAASDLTVTPTSYNFNTVPVGGFATWPVTIANKGTASLTVASISVSGAGYSVDPNAGANPCGTAPVLAAGGSCTVSVKIAPTVTGLLSGLLSVQSDVPVTTSATATFNATATAPPPSNSINGAIAYSGGRSGRIYLSLQGINGNYLGTSINWPTETTYTIRGVQPGTYTVTAFMDHLNLGTRVQTSPDGSFPATVSTTNLTGADIILTDPSPTAPPAPMNVSGSAGDSAVILDWDKPRNNGIESADAYDIYWGSSLPLDKTNAAGSRLNFPAGANSPAIIDGLTNSTVLYFIVIPKSGGVEGTASLPLGPLKVGAPTGGQVVSGTVNYIGPAATGPLYVAVADPSNKGAGKVFFTKIQSVTTSQNFTVSGVPDGAYEIFSIIDMNNDKIFGSGDVMDSRFSSPKIKLTGAGLTGITINLNAVNADTTITTMHMKQGSANPVESYNVEAEIQGQLKNPVKVTLTAAPAAMNLSLPIDIALSLEGHRFNFMHWSPTRPVVTDLYSFDVTYDDGTTDSAVSAAVTGVNDNFPTSPQVTTSTVPTFSWSTPAPPPAGYYGYTVWVNGTVGSFFWDSADLPDSTTSVMYGANGSFAPALSIGTQYNWQVAAKDQSGNMAAVGNSFTPTVPGTPLIVWNNPAAISFGTPLSAAQLNATAGGVAGSFVYTPPLGTILPPGTAQTLSASFIPSDTVNFSSLAHVSVTIDVTATSPGAPTIGITTTGNTMAAVSFTAPASDGGSAITGYTVTSSPGGFTGSGNVSPIVVSGLTNGTAYSFTVTATNAVGTGAASSPSTSVIPMALYPWYAYVPNRMTPGQISAFSVNQSTGALSPIGTYAADPGGDTDSLAVDPQGRFVYVTNSTPRTVNAYKIDQTTGTLTATGTVTGVGSYPAHVTVDPAGQFAYVTDGTAGGTIYIYSINQSSGALAPATPSSASTGTRYPYGMVIDPSGRFAYAGSDNGNNGTISMFTVNSFTGALSSIGILNPGGSIVGIGIDPTGRFVYAADRSANNRILMYSINQSTGVLTPLAPASVAAGNGAYRVTVDPTGRFAYASNITDNTVSIYSVNQTTGVLSSTGPAIAAGSGPLAISINPAATVAYVANAGGPDISAYSINPGTGSLTPVAGSPYAAGSAPNGMEFASYVIMPQTIGAISFTPNTLEVTGTTAVTATATSGLPVTFSSTTPAVCSVSGTTVTGISAGTCTIAADQTGNAIYGAALQATQSITVSLAAQTASVSNSPLTYSGSPLSATVTCLGGGAATNILVGGTATQTNAGTYAVTADCPATALYAMGTNLPAGSFVISPAAQSVLAVTGVPTSATFGQTGIVALATGGNGTGVVTFSTGSSTACTVNSVTGEVTITSGTGTCDITATKSSDTNYTANTSAPTSIATINKATQSIIFGSAPLLFFGGTTATVNASGGASGMAVSFSSLTPTICTVSGSTVTAASTGTCTIAADQAGDANYLPANQVTQNITVNIAAFTITAATINTNGTISPSGNTNLNYMGSQTYTIIPDPGYVIADIKVDGISNGTNPVQSFTNVATGHTIEVVFGPDGILDPQNTTGKPQITDALILLAAALGDAPLSPAQAKRADASPMRNGVPLSDGKIDLGDVVVMLRRVVGLERW